MKDAVNPTIDIDAATRVYAVLGDPIGHSLSPAMQNAAFAATGFPGVFVAFRVTDIASAVTGIRGLGLGGVAVTIPHKVSIISHLDQLDPLAEAIGAVNTVVNEDGRLTGYNSDCAGAMKALLHATPVRGKRVAVIGAGGAARAVGFGIQSEKGELIIYNRSKDRGEALAKDLDASFRPLSEVRDLACDILVNTSSVGMHPDAESSPIPIDFLTPGMVVMDIVYRPLMTRLMTGARDKGCTLVDGLSMFVNQGAFQFELWTGSPAPVDRMRETVRSLLIGEEEKKEGGPLHDGD